MPDLRCGIGIGVSDKTDSMISDDIVLLLTPFPRSPALGNTPVSLLKTACNLESGWGRSSWKLLLNIFDNQLFLPVAMCVLSNV